MTSVSVRYIVLDVDASIAFYTQHLGFSVDMHPAPFFAGLSRGDLSLLLSAPTGSGGAAQAMPDGRRQEPGGLYSYIAIQQYSCQRESARGLKSQA